MYTVLAKRSLLSQTSSVYVAVLAAEFTNTPGLDVWLRCEEHADETDERSSSAYLRALSGLLKNRSRVGQVRLNRIMNAIVPDSCARCWRRTDSKGLASKSPLPSARGEA